MTNPVPPGQIEAIVGVKRARATHYVRAVSAEHTVYILHSELCRTYTPDLRDCRFSRALDNGIILDRWRGFEGRPVVLAIDFDTDGTERLVPIDQQPTLAVEA